MIISWAGSATWTPGCRPYSCDYQTKGMLLIMFVSNRSHYSAKTTPSERVPHRWPPPRPYFRQKIFGRTGYFREVSPTSATKTRDNSHNVDNYLTNLSTPRIDAFSSVCSSKSSPSLSQREPTPSTLETRTTYARYFSQHWKSINLCTRLDLQDPARSYRCFLQLSIP